MPPANLSAIMSSDAPSLLPSLSFPLGRFRSNSFLEIAGLWVFLLPRPRTEYTYSKVPKSSAWKIRTALHAGPRTAGNAKRTAKEIAYAEKQGGAEMSKYETKVTRYDTGARSIIEDVHAGRRIMRRSGRLWTGEVRMALDASAGTRRVK